LSSGISLRFLSLPVTLSSGEMSLRHQAQTRTKKRRTCFYLCPKSACAYALLAALVSVPASCVFCSSSACVCQAIQFTYRSDSSLIPPALHSSPRSISVKWCAFGEGGAENTVLFSTEQAESDALTLRREFILFRRSVCASYVRVCVCACVCILACDPGRRSRLVKLCDCVLFCVYT
jgi:hypothetical protein